MAFIRNFFTEIAKSNSTRFLRARRHNHQMSFQPSTNMDPLFRYTSGRWLWNEREQLGARSRYFDVHHLQKVACQAVGASQCVSLEKIGEGNYNKAYRFTMEDGQRLIAKIPHPNAGPPLLTTSSEVATMEFARSILSLPVPKVLAWSATDKNPVKAEYILMEEAKGSPLYKAWEDLQLRTKRDIIYEIVDMERKLLSISFNRIGSLYSNDSGISGCEPADISETGLGEIRHQVQSRFCIGPTVRKEFWEKERSNLHQYQGPWDSSREYLGSVARREIAWIKTFADPRKATENALQYTSPEQHSPEAHIAALQKYQSAIPHIIPNDPELVSPRLWHPDFHAGNIYIDDCGRISSIIDWQGAWTTPVFIGANPPPLLDYGVEMMMKLPDGFKELDEATQDQLRYQVSQSILIHAYETRTAEQNPLMYKMMRHPHGKTLKQLDAFAGATWHNCLYPLQECLISVEREWAHFYTDQPCPYRFSAEELRRHDEEVETFNQSQEFWKQLSGILTDEGYTSNETFAEAVELIKELRERRLAGLEGEERDEFDRKMRWVLELGA